MSSLTTFVSPLHLSTASTYLPQPRICHRHPAALRAALPSPKRSTFSFPADPPIDYPVFTTSPTTVASAKPPIVFMQNPTGYGTTHAYWDPLIDQLGALPSVHPLRTMEMHRFDWIGTGDCTPKPRRRDPYLPQYFGEHMVHMLETLGKPAILVGQATAEPLVLWLVKHHPHLVRGVILLNGLSNRFVTEKPSKFKLNFSWSLFSSPLGMLFWYSTTTNSFLRSFASKNLLAYSSKDVLDSLVERLSYGCRGVESARRVRYAAFSFLSGFHFDDFTSIMKETDVPFYYVISKDVAPAKLKDTLTSVRVPIMVQAKEGVLLEDKSGRFTLRKGLFSKINGEAVTSGPELWFESPVKAVQALDRGINWIVDQCAST